MLQSPSPQALSALPPRPSGASATPPIITRFIVLSRRWPSYVYVTVATNDPHVPEFVLVFDAASVTPGTTRTSSTKSATEL